MGKGNKSKAKKPKTGQITKRSAPNVNKNAKDDSVPSTGLSEGLTTKANKQPIKESVPVNPIESSEPKLAADETISQVCIEERTIPPLDSDPPRKSGRQQVQNMSTELMSDIAVLSEYHVLILKELEAKPNFSRLNQMYTEFSEQCKLKNVIAKHDQIKALTPSGAEFASSMNETLLKAVDRVTADSRMIADRVSELISTLGSRPKHPNKAKSSNSHHSSKVSLKSSSSAATSYRSSSIRSSRSSRLVELETQARATLAEKESRLQTEIRTIEMEAQMEELERQKEEVRRSIRATRAQGDLEAEREKHRILLQAVEDEIATEQAEQLLQSSVHDTAPLKTHHSKPDIRNTEQPRTGTVVHNHKESRGIISPESQQVEQTSTPYLNRERGNLCFNDTSTSTNKSDHALLANAIVEAIHDSRLPPPQPFKFKGSLFEYTDWRRSVDRFIGQRRGGPEEKLALLMTYLSDDIKELISGYNLNGSQTSWTEALRTLDETYGDPFQQGEAFLQRLDSWPRLSNRGAELRRYCGFLKQCVASMETIPTLEDLNSVKETRRIINKLPENLKHKWVRKDTEYKQKHGTKPKLTDLVKYLEKEVQVACNPLNDNQPPSSTMKSLKKTTFSTTVETKPTKEHCFYCDISGHTLSVCRSLARLQYEKRVEFAQSKGLCYACLEPGHTTRECKDRATCKTCTRNHPTSLHSEEPIQWKFKKYQGQSSERPGSNQKPPAQRNQELPNQAASSGQQNPQKSQMPDISPKENSSTNDAVSINPDGTFKQIKEMTGLATGRYRKRTNYSMTTPVWVSSKLDRKNEILVYALHDTQSNASYIKSDVAKLLKHALRRKLAINLSTMSSQNEEMECLELEDIYVRPLNSPEGILINRLCTTDKLPAIIEDIPTAERIAQWPHLHDIANEIRDVPVEIPVALLIGYDQPAAFQPQEVVSSEKEEPFAIKYPLGWVVMGSVGQEEETKKAVCHKINATYATAPKKRTILFTHQTSEEFDSVIKALNQDFKVTENKLSMSVEDRLFIKTVTSGMHRDKEGFITMPLPLKAEPQTLNSRAMALHRFNLLTNRFRKDSKYKEQYFKFMNDVIHRNEAEKVPEEAKYDKSWYIPHFGVFHPKKPDKIRVVFDASAKVNGTSLNDYLLEGPQHMNSLHGILLKFRKEKVAVMCDIEKMFHNFRVTPSDRDYLRFLWYDDNGRITDYRMKVHIFGARSSPACATFGLRNLASTATSKTASRFIKENFYVDDGVVSVASTQEAKQLITEAREICRSGNLRLHKFVSNEPDVLEDLPSSERAQNLTEVDLSEDFSPEVTERTLGLQWKIGPDCFEFVTTDLRKPSTRRGVLSTVASLFDPLGLISPFILQGKVILQSLCQGGSEWDTPLDEKTEKLWIEWKQNMTGALENLIIPRCYRIGLSATIVTAELHSFSDASTVGYGQCSYLRLVDDAANVRVSLVMSKARVAPLKTVSIPRLELQAACTSIEISSFVKEQLQIDNLKETFWTDSKVVLAYINNESRRFHVYVANRVQRIRDYSTPQQWRYVPTDSNPADIASRGATPMQLLHSSWFQGPDFLQNDSIDMQSQGLSLELDEVNDPEVKRTVLATLREPKPLHRRLDTFSRWKSAVRSVTNLQQIIRRKKGQTLDIISAEQKAETTILLSLQQEYYSDEIQKLQADVPLKKNSPLVKLNPQLDRYGILRVGGRLHESSLSFAEKHPIIVPNKAHISQLIVRHYHEKTAHQGRGFTLARIKSAGYWITGSKAMIASCIHHCVICRKNRGKPAEQLMAPLPPDRTEEAPPFTYIGIDCFGPFTVKDGRKEVKRWGLLVTCMSSRAVHIELLEDMTADAFLNALRIVIAVRGKVRQVRSDRGSNFVGALSELKVSATSEWSKKLDMEFVFNPPHASHMGGAWERHIRSVRSILKGISGKYGGRFSTQTLRTAFYEIAAIINCRPLSAATEAGVMLTPNMLLTMKSDITLPPPGKFEDSDIYSRKRWIQVQSIANQFWRRYRGEYLNQLQSRAKWLRPKRNMKVGDVVSVNEGDAMRNDWKLAKVTECKQSSDGLVRSVKIMVGNGTPSGKPVILERPISKLILLVGAE